MYRRIIALNNMGVQSLQRGNLPEAIRLFRHAIDIVKTNLGNSPSEESSNNNTDRDGTLLIRRPLEFFTEGHIGDASPHNVFGIFTCAFGLPRLNGQSAHNTPHEISVTLMYNLALAHHLAGLLREENKRYHLVHALHHYKLSLGIFNSCKAQSDFDLSFCSLLCGSCTNCGHILSHLGRVREALICSDYLATVLESAGCTIDLTEDECEYFYTITYCSKNSCNVAPAA